MGGHEGQNNERKGNCMKNESKIEGLKIDRTRIQIRSVIVGSTAFAILLSIFQQAAAQIIGNNPYATMLNTTSNAMQSFWNQQNSYNNNFYRMSHGNSYHAPATPRQYPITATDFRPIFQRMAPDLVANSTPGLTLEQREEVKAFGDQLLTVWEAHWRKDNVANAMLYLYSQSLLGSSGRIISKSEYDQKLLAFNNALAGNADFITMSPRDKQLMYEEAIVVGGLIGSYYDQGLQQKNPALQSQAKEMSRIALRYLGFNGR